LTEAREREDWFAMQRLRPWLWAAWSAMALGGILLSLLPARLAGPVSRGLLASHLWSFALLALTGVTAARTGQVWRVIAVMAAIGVGIELGQLAIPGRACEWQDLRDDGVGMAIGWAAARLFMAARVWQTGAAAAD
jgi:hypothetical protein